MNKKIVFLDGVQKATEEKNGTDQRIRIRVKTSRIRNTGNQCCRSASARIRIHFGRLDPGSKLRIRVRIQEGQNDPQKWRKFKFWSGRCFLLRDKDFFCSLDVLYESIWLQFLIKKIFEKNFQLGQFLVIKPWIWIRICIETNADPQQHSW